MKDEAEDEENPWYRLAMPSGDPASSEGTDNKNRETWNRWMAPRLPEVLKVALRTTGWSDQELTLFSEGEQQSILAQIGSPLEAHRIGFSNTSFEAPFIAIGFSFFTVDFAGATFSSSADFVNAKMKGPSAFDKVGFSEPPMCFNAKLHEGTTWHDVRIHSAFSVSARI